MMQYYLKHLNNYYDKIYVITIEPAELRRQKLKESLKGLDFQYLFGADKLKNSIEDLKSNGIYDESLAIKHHRYSKPMMPGEVACAWSHRMVFEDMIAKGYEKVLVFEDDVVPDPAVSHLIPDILKSIPDDCEFLYWGWAKNGNRNFAALIKQFFYHITYTLGLLKWNHKIIRNLYARNYSTHFKKAGFHEYNNAYALTKSAAEKLLQLQTPIQFIADNLTAYACTTGMIKGYITIPRIFPHEILPDGTHTDSYIR
jgi:glycosyl transferase family 25